MKQYFQNKTLGTSSNRDGPNGYVETTDTDFVHVHFYGTDSLRDALQDTFVCSARVRLRNLKERLAEDDQLHVSEGFYRDALRVYHDVMVIVKPLLGTTTSLTYPNFFLSGHSYGAGIATNMALLLLSRFPKANILLHCLGGPKCVSFITAEYLAKWTTARHFTFGLDIVPRLPIPFRYHVGPLTKKTSSRPFSLARFITDHTELGGYSSFVNYEI